MKIIAYINVSKTFDAGIARGPMRYFNLMKSALFADRRFEEAPRIGLPFILLPLAGYAQMTVTAGPGTSWLRRHGDQDAQIREFCH
ncbi:MAG: hypothetical protein JO170_15440 [Verrucomicrobia bacterium]|nr:hypothetical protein [Verrucomicrobiota bacterium]